MNGRELQASGRLGQGLVSAGVRAVGRPVSSRGLDGLVVALLSPFLALSAGWMERALLAIVILDIPLQFGVHLFYREDEVSSLGALGGLSISLTTIALAGLYASRGVGIVAMRGRAHRAPHVNVPLLLYLAITTMTIAVARDPGLSLFEVFLLAEACLEYWYVASAIRSREDVVFIVLVLVIACLLESAIIIVMKLTVTPATTWPDLTLHIHAEEVGKSGVMRLGGTVGSPNFAAAYLSMSLTTLASVLFTNLGLVWKSLSLVGLALGGAALIFTLSRGGWIAFALSMTILCLLGWRRRGLSLRSIVVITLLAALYLPFQASIEERLLGDDKGSAESRVPLMKLAFRIIEDHPVLGVGANNFSVVMGAYYGPELRHGFRFAVHNRYLLVFAETGILGVFAFLTFLLGTLRKAWGCWAARDRLLSPLALGFGAGICGHLVHMTVEPFRGRPTQHLLWLVAGLLTAMSRLCTEARETPGSPA